MVCISHYNLAYLEKSFHLDRTKLQVIRCGIFVREFLRDPVPPDACRGNQTIKLLCVARLNTEKGHEHLFQSVSLLIDSGLRVHLTLAGDGPLRGHLEKLARELGIEACVTFLGAQSNSQVRNLLHAADILVLSSLREGMPIVLMEAMAAGRPVIATRIAGVPELAEDRVTGFLCPTGDSKAIAAAVEWILAHPDETHSIAAKAQQRVRDEFDRAKCTSELIQFWQRT
jgi:glycosyltransferase involved in cell wall biosynthesis